MSFGSIFDKYLVIHSPKLNSERLAPLKKEFDRVGIQNFELISPASADNRMLSLSLTHRLCQKKAKDAGCQTAVIFEDDVVFRKDFLNFWKEVEEEVLATPWDVLFFYRWYGKRIKESSEKVTLLNLHSTWCLHAYALNRRGMDGLTDAMATMAGSFAVDNPYLFELLREKGLRVMATSKNLAGQRGGIMSTITGDIRDRYIEDEFRIINPHVSGRIRWAFGKSLKKLSRIFRNLICSCSQ